MRERLIELLNKHCVLRQDVLDCTNPFTDDCPECLADYLLANGVIVPPCKVGDKVYVVVERYRMPNGVYEGNVKNFIMTKEKLFITTTFWNGAEITTPASDVFCDKEQAEQALKGGAE